MIKSLWHTLSNMGLYPEMPFSDKMRVRISNKVAIVMSIMVFVYWLFAIANNFYLPKSNTDILFHTFLFGLIIASAVIIQLNRMKRFLAAKIWGTILSTTLILLISINLPIPYGVEIYLLLIATYIFIVFDDLKTIIALFSIEVLAYIFILYLVNEHNPGFLNFNYGLIVRVLIGFTVLFMILLFLQRETDRYQEEIEIKSSELSDDRDRMEKLNFTKDKIFSIISHDLRSPINSLKGMLSLIHSEHLTKEEFTKATATLEKQVNQLSTSLDELLTWSKAQLHGINPNPEVVLLKPLIYEVVAVNKIAARNKKIIITTNIPTELETICDPNMLKSIVTNLTTNAIKFTPLGGAVSIFCRLNNNKVHINVEDTGIGISTADIEKILNPSVHFSTQGTNNEKGTGLGLVMCREFITKNNGELKIKSSPGKGSLFTVVLPTV